MNGNLIPDPPCENGEIHDDVAKTANYAAQLIQRTKSFRRYCRIPSLETSEWTNVGTKISIAYIYIKVNSKTLNLLCCRLQER